MAAKLPVWGIDLGQYALKAVRLQSVGEQVEIAEVFVHEHPQMLSAPDADKPALVRAAVEALQAKHDVRKHAVAVTVPGQMTLTRFAKLPPVEAKKIPDMVNYEAQQQIPFDMDEVVWDYEIFTHEGSLDVEVGIFAMRKELVRGQLVQYSSVGISPTVVQSAPFATYNALRYDGQFGDETTLVLDIGTVATDLLIIEGNSLWSRVIPLGGNSFTDALVKAFKLNFKKAEELKRQAASSKYARQILQAMRPVFADLVAQIQQSIGFYTSTRRQSEVKRCIGMGRTFLLPGMQKFLTTNLQLPVERFSSFTKIGAGALAGAPSYTENSASLSVAVGAALQALGVKTGITANLLPTEIVRQQLWKKKQVFFGASAACLAGAAGAIWLGTMLAQNALASKFGSVTSASVPPTDLATAERTFAQPPGRDLPPLEYGVRIASSLEKLKNEFAALPNLSDQQARLKAVTDLPTANPIIPQIVDLVQRVFAEVNSPAVLEASSSEEYAAKARQTPRGDRRDVWIERFRCRFDPRDASKAFSAAAAPTRGAMAGEDGMPPAEASAAGWTVIIEGRTTSSEAPALIDEIVTKLKAEGRKKDMKFWVKQVQSDNLARVGARPIGAARGLPPSVTPPSVAPGVDRDGRGSAGRPVAPTTPRGGSPLTGRGAPMGWQPDPTRDPVTDEPITGDSTFRIAMVIIRGPVPPDMVGKTDDKKGPETPAPAEPAPADRDER